MIRHVGTDPRTGFEEFANENKTLFQVYIKPADDEDRKEQIEAIMEFYESVPWDVFRPLIADW